MIGCPIRSQCHQIRSSIKNDSQCDLIFACGNKIGFERRAVGLAGMEDRDEMLAGLGGNIEIFESVERIGIFFSFECSRMSGIFH